MNKQGRSFAKFVDELINKYKDDNYSHNDYVYYKEKIPSKKSEYNDIDRKKKETNKKIEELQKKYNSALENYSATVQNWQQETQSYANNFNSKKIKFENEWQNLLAERRRLLDITEEENLARFYEEQREDLLSSLTVTDISQREKRNKPLL